MMKMFEIAIPIAGFEYHIVQADSAEEAKARILNGDTIAHTVDTDWDGAPEVNDEWEE